MQFDQGQEIVEVFAVWDCYEQQWKDELPRIIRFEESDVLVDSTGEVIDESVVAVDDHDEALLYKICGIPEQKSRDMCLCWLPKRNTTICFEMQT